MHNTNSKLDRFQMLHNANLRSSLKIIWCTGSQSHYVVTGCRWLHKKCKQKKTKNT